MQKPPEDKDPKASKPEHPEMKALLDEMANEVVRDHPALTFEEARARIKEAL